MLKPMPQYSGNNQDFIFIWLVDSHLDPWSVVLWCVTDFSFHLTYSQCLILKGLFSSYRSWEWGSPYPLSYFVSWTHQRGGHVCVSLSLIHFNRSSKYSRVCVLSYTQNSHRSLPPLGFLWPWHKRGRGVSGLLLKMNGHVGFQHARSFVPEGDKISCYQIPIYPISGLRMHAYGRVDQQLSLAYGYLIVLPCWIKNNCLGVAVLIPRVNYICFESFCRKSLHSEALREKWSCIAASCGLHSVVTPLLFKMSPFNGSSK